MFSDTQLGAAHLVAAALGRALGVRVVIANVPTACTDGNTIYLPPLPVTASAQLIAMLWGFIHHEAGHCRHSDFGVLEDLASEHDSLLVHLSRVFEDIRMERAHIALYPGAHRVLSDLVEVLVQIGFFKRPDPDDPPAVLATGLILKSLRSSLLGQTALSEQAQLHRELVEQKIGRGSVTRLMAICQQVCDARSSEDALNLAYRVREFLEEEQKKADQPPPPSPQSDKDSQDSASGGSQQSDANGSDDAQSSAHDANVDDDDGDADDTQSSPQGADRSDDAGPADADDASQSSPSADDPDQSDSSQPPSPSSSQSSDPTDGQDASANLRSDDSSTDDSASATDTQGDPTNRAGSAANSGSSADPAQFLQSVLSGTDLSSETQDLGEALAELINEEVQQVDGSDRMVLPATLPMGYAQRDAEAVHSALQVSAKLSTQLKRQLESERRMPSIPKSSGRRVSRRHLHRVAFKDYRVFERRVIETAINTSAVCLLDSSGSMGWTGTDRSRIEVAREALLATMMALGSIKNLKACAGAFPAGGCSDRVLLLADFGEAVPAVSSRFALGASGGTPMAEAILWGCQQLATRPDDERKIIFVATDGEPDRPDLTAQVIRSAERSGIEVYGLGIQTAAGRQLFRAFAEVHDLSRLCDAFLEIFQGALTRKRA